MILKDILMYILLLKNREFPRTSCAHWEKSFYFYSCFVIRIITINIISLNTLNWLSLL